VIVKSSRPSKSTNSFLREANGAVLIAIKAQPRASRSEVVGRHGDELKIKIAAPPVDSAANLALLEFLADTLSCRRSALTLLRGHNSVHKIVAIHGLTLPQISQALSP